MFCNIFHCITNLCIYSIYGVCVFANEHPLSPYQNQANKNQLRNSHQLSMNFPQNSLKHP